MTVAAQVRPRLWASVEDCAPDEVIESQVGEDSIRQPEWKERRPSVHIQTLQDTEVDLQLAEQKLLEAQNKKRQATAMLEEVEAIERQVVEEKQTAYKKRHQALERLRAETVGEVVPLPSERHESREVFARDTPSPVYMQAARCQLPPIIIDRSGEGIQSTTCTSCSSISEGSMRSREGLQRPKRRYRSSQVVALVRPARPRTIWGGPAWS